MAVMGRKAVFIILGPVYRMRASLAAQMVKNLRATWETRVGPLGREDPLEKEMTTHSNILAWRIPWTEEPSRLQSMGRERSLEKEMTTHSNILAWEIPWT